MLSDKCLSLGTSSLVRDSIRNQWAIINYMKMNEPNQNTEIDCFHVPCNIIILGQYIVSNFMLMMVLRYVIKLTDEETSYVKIPNASGHMCLNK